MNVTSISVPLLLFCKEIKCWILKDWLVAGMSYTMLPALLPVSKYTRVTLPLFLKKLVSIIKAAYLYALLVVDSSWNVTARGDAREGKWRGNWRMEWVASTLHTTSKHGVSTINIADAHNSAASCRLTWYPRRFKWTRPFRRKTKSCFCAFAITFQLASTCSDTLTTVWDTVPQTIISEIMLYCCSEVMRIFTLTEMQH